MKPTRVYLQIFLLIFLSCQSKEEKFINAEFNQIKGIWSIDSIMLPTNAPDSLKSFFKTGIMDFKGCKYNTKNFTQSAQSCAGDAEFNKMLMSFFYTYTYSNRLFKWHVSLPAVTIGTVPPAIDTQKMITYYRTSALFDGTWTVTIDGNKLKATRKNAERPYPAINPTFYQGDVSFTATRK